MHTLFISDLHLAPERPDIARQFFEFIGTIARDAEALYVLGDLFEYWVGDDELTDGFSASVAAALKGLSASGAALSFMHGNRDLLAGSRFAEAAGATLLPDPTELDLYGVRTLLMHGDTLCTDDIEYQRFRSYARNPENQAKFLSLPLDERRRQAQGMRRTSESSKQVKTDEIMDVTPAAVEQALREHGYPRLIHGHTHRPARHVHRVDGHDCERWVLNDWYVRGGYLRCADDGSVSAHQLGPRAPKNT
jgi:UDP-2,3-diacylglucosamine hydrolase